MRRLLPILPLLLASPSWAVITHIGSTQSTGSSGVASVTRSAGSTTNLYTVFCGNATGTATLVASNTTTAFTWTSIFGPTHNGSSEIQAFWAKPSTTASQTITCTATPTAGFTNILLDEWAGTETSTPIDVSSGTFATLTACSTTGTMSVNDEAMVSGAQDSITVVGNINSSAATKGADDGFQDWTEYRINSGAGAGSTIVASYTGTASSAECITFGIKPPAAGASTPQCGPPFCGLLGQ